MATDEPMGIIELDENLADVEKPKEIPPGKYVGEVQDVQETTSAKGNTYFAIQFRVPQTSCPQMWRISMRMVLSCSGIASSSRVVAVIGVRCSICAGSLRRWVLIPTRPLSTPTIGWAVQLA